MRDAQVSSEIGHAIEHLAADGARLQAFVSLPAQDQRFVVLVNAATVLASHQSA